MNTTYTRFGREKKKEEEANDPIKILSKQVQEQQKQIIQLQKQVDALTK